MAVLLVLIYHCHAKRAFAKTVAGHNDELEYAALSLSLSFSLDLSVCVYLYVSLCLSLPHHLTYVSLSCVKILCVSLSVSRSLFLFVSYPLFGRCRVFLLFL